MSAVRVELRALNTGAQHLTVKSPTSRTVQSPGASERCQPWEESRTVPARCVDRTGCHFGFPKADLS